MRRISLGIALLLGICLTALLAACGDDEEAEPTPTPPVEGTATPAEGTPTPVESGPPAVSGEPTVTDSGLQYIDIVVGTGPSPATGETAVVHYTGWLTDGTKFDSSIDRAQPFRFTIGIGQVIAGWDEGVATMGVGGKRRLIIPPELGYGESGSPPVIPANAELIFDVELLAIE
jgi:peptidylprolyl isomerase